MVETKTFPVIIPKAMVTQKKNKNGNNYFIVKIPNTTKEVYIPFEWIKLDAKDKFYKGTFSKTKELQGRQRNSIKVLAGNLEGIWPTKDAKNI